MSTKLTAEALWETPHVEMKRIFNQLALTAKGRWMLSQLGGLVYDALGMKVSSLPRIPDWPETLAVYPREEQPQRPEVGPLLAGKPCEDGSVYLGYGTLDGKLLLVLPDFRVLQPKGRIRASSASYNITALRGIGADTCSGRIVDYRPPRWRVTNPATGKQQTYMREADAMSEKARIVSMLQDELPAHLKDFVKVDPDTVTVEEVRE